MEKESILMVEDDEQVLLNFEKTLSKEGYNTKVADNVEKALKLIKENKYNLLLVNIEMKRINGMQILEETKKISPETEIILIVGYESADVAFDTLRKDAIDFIVKPCEKEELRLRIKHALERQRLRKRALKDEIYKEMSETLGAVAHEINNPLTTIIGNAELISYDLSSDHPMYKQTKAIERSAERIAEIIEKMRKTKGIEMKQYTKDSKIIDIQKIGKFEKPEEKTILIVDDEESITSVYSIVLERDGYKVDTADSGIEALDMIKEKNYSIVILDICMPEIDGYETLKKMNEYYSNKEIQSPATIMITGYDVENILQECKNIGAFTTLLKPLKNKILIDTIRQAEEFVKENNKTNDKGYRYNAAPFDRQ